MSGRGYRLLIATLRQQAGGTHKKYEPAWLKVMWWRKCPLETEKNDYDPRTYPLWNMHHDPVELYRGRLSFEMLRASWVAWAKQAIAMQESQEEHGVEPALPDS